MFVIERAAEAKARTEFALRSASRSLARGIISVGSSAVDILHDLASSQAEARQRRMQRRRRSSRRLTLTPSVAASPGDRRRGRGPSRTDALERELIAARAETAEQQEQLKKLAAEKHAAERAAAAAAAAAAEAAAEAAREAANADKEAEMLRVREQLKMLQAQMEEFTARQREAAEAQAAAAAAAAAEAAAAAAAAEAAAEAARASVPPAPAGLFEDDGSDDLSSADGAGPAGAKRDISRHRRRSSKSGPTGLRPMMPAPPPPGERPPGWGGRMEYTPRKPKPVSVDVSQTRPSLSEAILRSGGKALLKKTNTVRSPGGTPLEKRPLEPVFSEALRDKFKNFNHEMEPVQDDDQENWAV